MRAMEAFHWEDDGRACAYSPSEALLYALVHDHQPYARYLLNRYSVSALGMPSQSFCCCQFSTTPHLTMAVRYNRTSILKMILNSAKDFSEAERLSYLNRRSCVHVEGGKTALHLACDLIGQSNLDMRLKHICLGYLILFMPNFRFQMREQLRDNAALWRSLIGEQAFRWLCGLSAPSLFVQAMQKLIQSVSVDQLEALPLPDFLKPLDFRLQ
ncbi:hypothetical protein AAFF_G00256270 [Aldrovandia affinis]|uniref:Ankyrin repeat domain-containing protein 9 n=1 Tax=Aldrovandia affinis TaxID=143900 RepID=A0AAD7RCH4_9TELE|nr:hypothetical protein AAFF_G00256270 [Aldrovandia affinis]